jgi:glycosyltransferase involved in cell wall biosynthesis
MSAGGAERQVASLACELQRRGHKVRVRVLRLDGENGHYLSYLKAHGVDICVPRMPGFADVQFLKKRGLDIALIKHLPPELRLDTMALVLDLLRQPVDIVHCYLDWCCCYGGFAALLSGMPHVRFSWRNVNPTHFEFYRHWMPLLYEFLIPFSRIRVESNSFSGALDYSQWLRWPAEKIEVIPNGVDPALFSSGIEKNSPSLREKIGIAPGAPLVVSVGRLLTQKRPLDLPDILVSLRKDLPLASLVHVGSGPLKHHLRKRATLTGLNRPSGKSGDNTSLFLLGRREDVFDILRMADVLLLPSAYEGMPNVIMEAMLAGVPVVATRVGGVPDLIQDGLHGFLHEVGDLTGMTRSLKRLLTDPVLRQRMGKAGRERILAEFTIDHLADRITRSYVTQCSAVK